MLALQAAALDFDGGARLSQERRGRWRGAGAGAGVAERRRRGLAVAAARSGKHGRGGGGVRAVERESGRGGSCGGRKDLGD